MEYDKINNLLGRQQKQLPKFVTRNLIKVSDSAQGIYNDERQIRFKTSMLRSDLCDYCDAYIWVKGIVTVEAVNDVSKRNRPIILKNNAPFISCVSKINNELIENAEDLDIVMPMYNLLEYNKNYKKTTGSLFNFYRDELSDDEVDNRFINNDTANSKPFKFKSRIMGNTYNVPEQITDAAGNQVNNPDYDTSKSGTKEVEVAVPLKYLGNFWRGLNMPLVNCEISLTLTWSKNCVITSWQQRRTSPDAAEGVAPICDNQPTDANRL